MSVRMLTIETRRNIGILLFPILAGLAGKLAYDRLQISEAVIWSTRSGIVRDSLFSIGPFVAGIAAWVSGRESRRALGDLLATTPRPELQRRMVAFAATALWGVLVYLSVACFILIVTYLQPAWGAPTLWPMLTGLLAVLAHAALGYAFGYYLDSRFTAPLVAIGLFAIQMFVGDQQGWARWLSPVAPLETTVWYGIRPYLGLAQTLFLLGLTGLAWAAVAVRSGSRRIGIGIMIGAALLTVGGVGETLQRQRDGVGLMYATNTQGELVRTDRHQLIPYTPICTNDPLPVCVHPAYESQLAPVATIINDMTEPLLGIPGAPTKAEQLPFGDRVPAQPDVLAFDLRFQVGFLTAYDLAENLTRDDLSQSPEAREAQTVFEIWLMERAGMEIDCGDGKPTQSLLKYNQRLCEPARRFAALDPVTQRSWLNLHYADLRAGKVRLEDLP